MQLSKEFGDYYLFTHSPSGKTAIMNYQTQLWIQLQVARLEIYINTDRFIFSASYVNAQDTEAYTSGLKDTLRRIKSHE